MPNAISDKWSNSHRPWPIPKSPWVARQSWNDLLFLHYPIAIDQLRKLVPTQLPLDTFDGTGWISIVPFKMNNIGIRGIPFSIQFPELNVRTYVTIDKKHGVYFFSLDATNLPVVLLSNTFLDLPYFHSTMNIVNTGATTQFSCQRKTDTQIQFNCSYKPISEPFYTKKGSLDYWLTERYCFYVENKAGKINRCEIIHEPWPIQQASVDIHNNTLPIMKYINKDFSPLCHYSKGVDIRAWLFERAN